MNEGWYPLTARLGVKVYYKEGMAYVIRSELTDALGDRLEEFKTAFGDGHTQFLEGPYVYDVEAALERMGKR